MEVMDHLPNGAGVEENLWQAHKLIEDCRLGVLVDAVGGVGEDVTAHGLHDAARCCGQEQQG